MRLGSDGINEMAFTYGLADPALMARFASTISGWCFDGLTTWHLFPTS